MSFLKRLTTRSIAFANVKSILSKVVRKIAKKLITSMQFRCCFLFIGQWLSNFYHEDILFLVFIKISNGYISNEFFLVAQTKNKLDPNIHEECH